MDPIVLGSLLERSRRSVRWAPWLFDQRAASMRVRGALRRESPARAKKISKWLRLYRNGIGESGQSSRGCTAPRGYWRRSLLLRVAPCRVEEAVRLDGSTWQLFANLIEMACICVYTDISVEDDWFPLREISPVDAFASKSFAPVRPRRLRSDGRFGALAGIPSAEPGRSRLRRSALAGWCSCSRHRCHERLMSSAPTCSRAAIACARYGRRVGSWFAPVSGVGLGANRVGSIRRRAATTSGRRDASWSARARRDSIAGLASRPIIPRVLTTG